MYVLIADHDDYSRGIAVSELGKAGFKVLEARNCIEALSYLWSCPLAVIICALNFPDYDGHTFLQAVREFRDGLIRTPFFFVTPRTAPVPAHPQDVWYAPDGYIVEPVENPGALTEICAALTVPTLGS